jgi:hypothetical protein
VSRVSGNAAIRVQVHDSGVCFAKCPKRCLAPEEPVPLEITLPRRSALFRAAGAFISHG